MRSPALTTRTLQIGIQILLLVSLAQVFWWAIECYAMRRENALDKTSLVIAVFVVLNLAVYAVFEGGARHHVPMVPLLIAFVATRFNRI